MKKYFFAASMLLSFGLPVWAQQALGTTHTTFAIIGDYGFAGDTERLVRDMVDGWQPEFIVTVGDNTYGDKNHKDFQGNVGDYYGKYMVNKDGRRRFYPSLGNHDYIKDSLHRSGDPTKYLSYFGVPNNYTFTWGACKFFIFDSGGDGHHDESNDGGGKFTDEAVAKMKEWLPKNTAKDTVYLMFFHHPPYCEEAGSQKVADTINAYHFDKDVDAIICGHAHLYERLVPTANPSYSYVICGSSGVDDDDSVYVKPANLAPGFINQITDRIHHGAIKATITETAKSVAVHFEYYVIGDKASVLEDKFDVVKAK